MPGKPKERVNALIINASGVAGTAMGCGIWKDNKTNNNGIIFKKNQVHFADFIDGSFWNSYRSFID